MTEDRPDILDLIDNTLDDSTASDDAMRWVPDARACAYEAALKRIEVMLRRDVKAARKTLDLDRLADAYELAISLTVMMNAKFGIMKGKRWPT